MAGNILIVEDEESTRKLHGMILESAGYKVQAAEDGRHALSLLRGSRFDAILCDINMPHMDGFDFLKNVKERFPRDAPPIIMITVEYEDEKKARARGNNASAWLVKPVDREKLLIALKRYIPDGTPA